MGTLRRSCAKVREPSKLRYGEVLRMGRGIAVLDGSPRSETGRGDFEDFLPFYAHVAARSIFRAQLPCASARIGLACWRNS